MQLSLIADKRVISMSRRTEMAWYPEKFCHILKEKYTPEIVHSIIIWTKFPGAILKNPYKEVLSDFDQLYVHLTITGLGGTEVEPNVPGYKKALSVLPDLIDFVGSPDRIRIRPDPLIRLKQNDTIIDNFENVKKIISTAQSCGVNTFSTSFCSPYEKVINRLFRHGYRLLQSSRSEQIQRYNVLEKFTKPGILYACNIPGAPVSKCIDGDLLSRLHPLQEACSNTRAKNQRELCGCTHSVDLGWYNMVCKSGCLYCYANTN